MMNNKNPNCTPLFCLMTSNKNDYGLTEQIEGTFEYKCSEYIFRTNGQDTRPVQLRIHKHWRSEEVNIYLPLIQFLSNEMIPIIITGTYLKDEGIYEVQSLELDGNKRFLINNRLHSDGFLNAILAYLKTASTNLESRDHFSRPELRDLDEFEQFYEICEHTFPAWLSEAMEKEIYRAKNRNQSSTHRNHAITALQYLQDLLPLLQT